MLEKIILNIKNSPTGFESINDVIDKMQRIWETIEQYPSLYDSTSEKVKKLCEEVKRWIKGNLDIMETKMAEII